LNLLLEELIGVFEDQSDLHQSLISVLRDEKAAIVGSKLFELNKANKDKETLILKIKKLEDKRFDLASTLANSLDDESDDLTLEKLCKITNEPYSSRLNHCRENIMSSISKVKEINDGNKILLTNSIKTIRGSLTLLNNLMTSSSNAVYYPSGKIENGDRAGRVFSEEI
jgi:flagellar biosynthesis/type III secretory pathway chaperone